MVGLIVLRDDEGILALSLKVGKLLSSNLSDLIEIRLLSILLVVLYLLFVCHFIISLVCALNISDFILDNACLSLNTDLISNLSSHESLAYR